MLSHVLRQHTQSDRGEVVDRKARALWVIFWKEALPIFLQAWLLESFGKFFEPKLLLQLLKQDLDKDSRAAGGVLFIHVHDGQRCPADAVGRKQVAEEASNVAQSIGLVSMDGVVVSCEAARKRFRPLAMELAEALAHVAIELAVGSLLRTALDDHVAQLDILTFGDVELQKLVDTLLKVE